MCSLGIKCKIEDLYKVGNKRVHTEEKWIKPVWRMLQQNRAIKLLKPQNCRSSLLQLLNDFNYINNLCNQYKSEALIV